jgi:hypothetical protein
MRAEFVEEARPVSSEKKTSLGGSRCCDLDSGLEELPKLSGGFPDGKFLRWLD